MESPPTSLSASSIAVSIISYGTSELVFRALPALLEELAPCPNARVVIVDNASPGGDGEKLETDLAKIDTQDRVDVIRSDTNGGFAAGNNIAFAAIRKLDWKPDAVLLLNPDAEVLPGTIAQMMDVLKAQPKAGFVGPRLQNTDGTNWVAAFNFPSFGTEVWRSLGVNAIARHFPILAEDSDHPKRVDWVTGTATLIRRETLEDIGDMDDGYFLYFEEIDFMRRGGQLGWESWHAPAACVLHEAGAATGVTDGRSRQGRQPAYWFQAWARYFSKNHGPVYARATSIGKLCAMLVAHLHRSLRGKPTASPEMFYSDFLLQVVFARLSPPPMSPVATSSSSR